MAQAKIYAMVTERVVHAIQDAIKNKAPIAPWQKPWHGTGIPTNLISKKPYRGMNVFLLSMTGFTSPYFLSFKQATELHKDFVKWGMINRRKVGLDKDGTIIKAIKKDEKGMPVVFWKFYEVTKDENGNELDKPRKQGILRYYTVFNVDQCQGLNEKKIPTFETREFNPIVEGDAIIEAMPNRPEMTHDQARAFYMPSTDKVNLPPHESFTGDPAYYSTAFHELAHATGHKSRLARKEVMDSTFFGSHDYSVEELVAEMTAVFLCNEIGLDATFDNSIAYLKNWLSKLKDDTKMLITAAGRAQKASDFILDRKPEPPKDEDKKSEKSSTKYEKSADLVPA